MQSIKPESAALTILPLISILSDCRLHDSSETPSYLVPESFAFFLVCPLCSGYKWLPHWQNIFSRLSGKTFIHVFQGHKNLLLVMRCFFNLGFEAIRDGCCKDVEVNHLGDKTKNDLSWGISIDFCVLCIRKKYSLSNMKRPGVSSFILNTSCP